MFGKKKEGNKKHRWFYKVESLEDAQEAMKAAYTSFYAIAGIQTLVILFLGTTSDTNLLTHLLDPIFMVFMALLIQLRQSRTAAVLLLVYSIYIGLITMMARFGAPIGVGGKNVVLAIMAIYGAYKGVQGTYKFHVFSKTRTIWKNTFKQTGIIAAYSISYFVIISLLTIVPEVEALSDNVLGSIILIPVFAIILLGSFHILPGTRNLVLVAIDGQTQGKEGDAPKLTEEEYLLSSVSFDDVKTNNNSANLYKNNNYIARHWRGQNTLIWAYWVNLVVVGIFLNGAISYLDKSTNMLGEITPYLIIVTLVILISVWGWIGVWKSANKYIELAKNAVPKKLAFWGYTAQFMVAIGVMQVSLSWYNNLTDFSKAYMAGNYGEYSNYYLQYKGETDIILNGYINKSSVEDLKRAFIEDKKRTALVLNSPGGILLYAYELADFIEQNNLLVAAKGDCFSSCLLVLAAAETAVVTPDVNMAFHHPEPLADFQSKEMKEVMAIETNEYYQRFKRYGVPEAKLAEYRDEKFKYLSIGEAYTSYIIDKIWEPVRNEFLNIEDVCKQTDCFISPVKLPANGSG